MSKAKLDPTTVRWFMRRIRAKEWSHNRDACECAQLRDKVGQQRAEDIALSFGIFGDLIAHEARGLLTPKKTKRRVKG